MEDIQWVSGCERYGHAYTPRGGTKVHGTCLACGKPNPDFVTLPHADLEAVNDHIQRMVTEQLVDGRHQASEYQSHGYAQGVAW